MRLPFRTKLGILIALASGLPLLGGALTGLPFLTSRLRESAVQQILLKAAAIVREIQGQLDRAREDALLLSRLPQARAFLRDGPRADALRQELEAALVAFAMSKPVYDQVRLLDDEGREQARVNQKGAGREIVARALLQDKSDRYYFRSSGALSLGEVYVSQLDWNMEHGELELPLRATIRYCAAVFGTGPDRLGLAVLNLDGETLLSALDPAGLAGATVQLLDEEGVVMAERNPGGGLVLHHEALVEHRRPGPSATVPGRDREMRYRVEAEQLLVDLPVAPVPGEVRPAWCVRICLPSSQVFAPVGAAIRAGLFSLGAILLLSLAAGSWLARRITRPLLELTEDSRRLAAGDFTVRTVTRTGDEMEVLATALGQAAGELARQRKMEERLLRAEKQAELGQFAAEVAHEVGNPLAAMKATLQAIQQDDAQSGTRSTRLDRVVGEIERLAETLRWVRQTAPGREPSPIACDPRTAIEDVAAAVRAHATQRGVPLRIEVAAGCPPALADQQHLRQILFNLLLNAVDASPPGAAATVSAGGKGGRVRFSVGDAGSGILPADRERVFDASFSTKPGGSGLGLWVTRRLARENGGDVRVEETESQGARFVLELLAAPEAGDARDGRDVKTCEPGC